MLYTFDKNIKDQTHYLLMTTGPREFVWIVMNLLCSASFVHENNEMKVSS